MMAKKISLKKHITPGVVVETEGYFGKVVSCGEEFFYATDAFGITHPFAYDAAMTVYSRLSDNKLPF